MKPSKHHSSGTLPKVHLILGLLIAWTTFMAPSISWADTCIDPADGSWQRPNVRHELDDVPSGTMSQEGLVVHVDRPGRLWLETTASQGQPVVVLRTDGDRSTTQAPRLELPTILRLDVVKPTTLNFSVISQVPGMGWSRGTVHLMIEELPAVVHQGSGDDDDGGDDSGGDQVPPEIIPVLFSQPSFFDGVAGPSVAQVGFSDTMLCASPVIPEQPIRGSLDGLSHDRDVLHFDVEGLRRITLTAAGEPAAGEPAISLRLYDQRGTMVAEASPSATPVAVGGIATANVFSLDRIVPKGRYFVSLSVTPSPLTARAAVAFELHLGVTEP